MPPVLCFQFPALHVLQGLCNGKSSVNEACSVGYLWVSSQWSQEIDKVWHPRMEMN